jgi:4-hydroxy-tetrahydrodipicolinate synthase
MSGERKLKGIVAVMPSFFHENGEVDGEAISSFSDHLAGSGIHGILVLGSNGECPYIRKEDRKRIVEMVVESCAGRVPVIVGVNERGLDEAVDMVLHAGKAGADAALVALHRFHPLGEREVMGFYRDLSSASEIPLLYYNFPSHTGITLPPEAIASMAEKGFIIGAKETIFDMEEIGRLASLAGEGFSTFTGTTLNLSEAMAVGACGAICPLPNIVPDLAVELFQALEEGDVSRATKLQEKIRCLAPLLASPAPHAMVKEALRLLGHRVSATVKSPLPPIDEDLSSRVMEVLRISGLA